MDLFESAVHSFVIRIWLEETAEEADHAKWRGHITHIPSNARRYIENLDDIGVFIVPYLEAMGVRPGRETHGGLMSSIFPFLRGSPESSEDDRVDEESTEAAPGNTSASSMPAITLSVSSIPHGAPTLDEILTAIRTALSVYLVPAGDSLPAPNVSVVKVQEKPTGLGNHIGDERRNQFSFALKGGRLQASVRFQLWAATPEDVDQAIDELHGRLLAAREELWIAGFLRFVAEDSTLAEHIPSLTAWRRTADYQVLYEFRYTDSDGAQSLIARIPIHTDPETLNSPQRETAVVTDEMARWDEDSAPALDLHGRLTISRFSALSFAPGPLPTAPVMLLRTFDGAAGPATAFPDLAQFVTAVTDPENPERHGQVSFASISDFLAAFSSDGDPITLGDWDEDTTPDSYQPLLLELPEPITLQDGAEHLQLIYQPGSTDPQFDQTAVLYIRAGHL